MEIEQYIIPIKYFKLIHLLSYKHSNTVNITVKLVTMVQELIKVTLNIKWNANRCNH